jgi:hypothetical protein
MRLTYTAEARMELVDAARYYRSCHKELGREFKQRVEAAEDDILLHRECLAESRSAFPTQAFEAVPLRICVSPTGTKLD